ncbi:LysR family transcriptional regulator [Pendulispora albinea]|uniref:LysR family transcriptional regulator n=1 Tax=Pendulispora albinea TaxID=2741071 RepID=A0ABZ2M0B7_9BACT
MDRLLGMTLFVRAVDRGSFAEAAREFQLTPAMVGRHVRALEERAGAQLLQRTTRKQTLTAFGRLYYERCTRVLAEIDAMDRSADELRAAPRGLLRVTTTTSFGAHRLAPALADYFTRYPEVRVELLLSDRFADIVENEYDAAVRLGPLAPSHLVARRLRSVRFFLAASPSYLAARGAPKRPEDLRGHACLGHPYGDWGREWPIVDAGGQVHPIKIRCSLKINSGEGLRIAALRGMGIILQPEFQVEDDLASGKLVRVLPDHRLPEVPMHILYPPQKPVSPRLRTFVDFVVERFGRT